MARIFWLSPLLLLAGFCQGPGLQAQDVFYRPAIKAEDIDKNLRTDWYGLYLKGTKNGYFKTTRARVGDNVVESFELTMKVVAMDKKAEIKISQAQTFEGKAPHRLLSGVFRQDDGSVPIQIRVSRTTPRSFDFVLEAGGQKRVRKVEDLDYTLSDSMASETWLRSAPKVGDKIIGKDLDLQEWKSDQTTYLLTAVKDALVGGVNVKFYEVDGQSKKDGIRFLSRNTANGDLLQGTLGGVFEIRKETEAQAKDTKYSQDLFVLGQAKIDRNVGPATRLTELVLEIEGEAGAVLENGPRQTVSVERPGVRRIKIGKKFANEVKASAKEIAENLEETNAYAVKDPQVVALAKKAVGTAKTPEEKVRRIVAFVRNYIRGEAVATLPNIHDLLEKKQGDCKSYALMTTNLCRAAGIPARDVSGLVYMGDGVKAFGGHAWNEVVLNGVWVPVDASRGQAEVDAGHICLGTDQRANRAMLESLGRLSFKVIESHVD